jgi:catechol 2,3-dioxygenase-like lactoylglutathione lyase family enzyme
MAVPARLSIVTLGVADLARARAFYEALGWRVTSGSSDEIVWFATADSMLGLYPRTELAADAQLAPGDPGDFGGIVLGLNVESESLVDSVLDEAVAAGARLVAAPVRAEWGGYRGYFADPDGHPWEVLYHPYMSFRDDGSLVND